MKVIDIFKKEKELERPSIDDLFKEFRKDRRLHKLCPDSSRESLEDLNKFESNYKSFLLMFNKGYLNLLLENHGIRPFNEIKSNDSPYLFEFEKKAKGWIDKMIKKLEPKKEYLLKIDKSIGLFGFEENNTNLPNVVYAIYNGEIIDYGSIDFIKPKFKINKNGKILGPNFKREQHKNSLELPPKYDSNKLNIPLLDFSPSYYANYKMKEYVKVIGCRDSSLLFQIK